MGVYVFFSPTTSCSRRSHEFVRDVLNMFYEHVGVFRRRLFSAYYYYFLLDEVMDKNAFSMLARRSAAGDAASLADLKNSCPPDVWEYLGNPLKQARAEKIKLVSGENPLLVSFLSDYLQAMSASLLGPDSNPLEKLAVDSVIDSWLDLSACKGDERRFDRAQRRHLNSIRVLSSIQKSATSITVNVLAAHPLRPALVRLMDGHDYWSGTATALGESLGAMSPDLPRSPQVLSGLLRKLAPIIREKDKLELRFGGSGRDRQKTRCILVRKIPCEP